MKLFAVFLLVGFALAEGRIVTKCALRDQLVTAIGSQKRSELSGVNLVARLVCHAQRASGFNTSTVTELISLKSNWPHNDDSDNPVPVKSSQDSSNPSTKPSTPIQRKRRAVKMNDKFGTLYGIFQLSNRLVCSDGTTPSPTICGVACSKLIEDNISDDIKCVLNVLTSPDDDDYFGDELTRMKKFILESKCSDVENTSYFSDCPPS